MLREPVRDRTKLIIDYVLRAAPATSTVAWLLGSLAAKTVLSALLMRRASRM